MKIIKYSHGFASGYIKKAIIIWMHVFVGCKR